MRNRTVRSLGGLVGLGRVVLALGEQHAVALEDAALVGEVDRRDLDALAADVVPDVQLGPVGDREDPHVLALVQAAVVEAPQLGALHLRVPLAELVAVGVDALLGAGLLLVAAAATEGGGEAVLLDGVEQGADLVAVAAGLAVVDDDRRWRAPPRRWPRSGGRRAGRPSCRGRTGPRGSRSPCRPGGRGTGSSRGRRPSRPGAASRCCPCPRRTSGPASRTRRRPHGRCGSTRPRAGRAGSAGSRCAFVSWVDPVSLSGGQQPTW